MSYWHTASFVAACDTFYALYAKTEGNPRRDYTGPRRKNVALAQTPRRSLHRPIRTLFTPDDGETTIRTLKNLYIIQIYKVRAKRFREHRVDGYVSQR